MSTLLTKVLDTYLDNTRGVGRIRLSWQQRTAAAHLGVIRRDPGDLAKLGEPYFVGFAIALTFIGKGPGWIPEVQKLGCELGELAESILRQEEN